MKALEELLFNEMVLRVWKAPECTSDKKYSSQRNKRLHCVPISAFPIVIISLVADCITLNRRSMNRLIPVRHPTNFTSQKKKRTNLSTSTHCRWSSSNPCTVLQRQSSTAMPARNRIINSKPPSAGQYSILAIPSRLDTLLMIMSLSDSYSRTNRTSQNSHDCVQKRRFLLQWIPPLGEGGRCWIKLLSHDFRL